MKDTDTQAIPHAAPGLSSVHPERRFQVLLPKAASDSLFLQTIPAPIVAGHTQLLLQGCCLAR